NDNFIGTPIANLEWTRSSITCFEPRIAVVGIIFVIVGWSDFFRMLFEQLLINDSTHGGSQTIEHKAWRIRFIHGQLEGMIVDSFCFFDDVISGKPKLG